MAVKRALRYQILRRDNHACRYCGRRAPEVKLTVDHVLPEALGGSDDPTNLVTACEDCNGGKSATPPDAALVAEVDEDAIRWARARHIAAERALADFKAREAARNEFEQAWNRWKAGGQPLPLPAEWRETVDRFLSLGLPMPLLLDAISVAMASRAQNVFNYMCGVAWNRVREIDNTAHEIVNSETGTAPGVSGAQLGAELLNLVTDWYGDDYYAEILDQIMAEGIPASEQLAEGARRVIKKLLGELDEAGVTSWRLAELDSLLDPDFHEEPETDDESADLLVINSVANQLATARLESLPEEQRACWLAVAASAGAGPGWPAIRFAADWSKRHRETGRIPHRVCGMPTGTDGVICSERTLFKLEIESCAACRETCKGHAMCERHAADAVDGKIVYADGKPIAVESMSDITDDEVPF